MDLAYVSSHLPKWDALATGNIPKSKFIAAYEERTKENPGLPPLRWTPTTTTFRKDLKKVFILAEDSRFYSHAGIDLTAIKDATIYNYNRGKIALGASTISQQTAKNLFLTNDRTPLRKWHELILTLSMEHQLTKDAILHLYLNIAEFGQGVYGLEAAAQTYFGVSSNNLSIEQAIALAASLPSPKKHNPKTKTRRFLKRTEKIAGFLRMTQPPLQN